MPQLTLYPTLTLLTVAIFVLNNKVSFSVFLQSFLAYTKVKTCEPFPRILLHICFKYQSITFLV